LAMVLYDLYLDAVGLRFIFVDHVDIEHYRALRTEVLYVH